MAIVVAVILGMVALIFVLSPLYRRGVSFVQVSSAQEISLPAEKEQSARIALHDVELDYQLGNISEADYRALHERYMRSAMVAMKEQAGVETPMQASNEREKAIDEQIEECLRRLKENKGNDKQTPA